MKIGFDFDNTIVNYDKVFYDIAIEWALIPKDLPINKLAVRNFLRTAGQEDRWTEMQGYVYGVRMDDAQLYPGALEFIQYLKNSGYQAVIVSHKTQHPFLGPKYDLHASAYKWIQDTICLKGIPIFNAESIYFEPTKEKKLQRISELGCDFFIDDLPEIVSSLNFPKHVSPILFDPDREHATMSSTGVRIISSWKEIQSELSLPCL